MYFSKSLLASGLLGLAAATNHEVGEHAVAEPPVAAHISTPVVAAHASSSVAPAHVAPPVAEHMTSVAVVETPAAHVPPPPVVEHVSSPPAAVEHVSSAAPIMEHVSSAVAPVAEHMPSSVAPVAEHVSSSVAVAETPAAHISTVAAAHSSSVAAHATSVVAVSETPAAHASMPPAAHPSLAAGGNVNTHVVQVGGPNGSLIFSPENIVAQPGDLVQFQFNPKNHSVVQSTFDQPCVPIQNIMPNKTDAFFSGFMPANATSIAAGNLLTYTIRVMDTKPIWYYCSQGQHCQAGMVGAINAPPSGNRTMQSFKSLAAAAPENLSPGQQAGQGAPVQSSAPSSGAGASQSVAGGATPSSPDNPAQQTTNAASRISQSFIGLAITMLAACLVL